MSLSPSAAPSKAATPSVSGDVLSTGPFNGSAEPPAQGVAFNKFGHPQMPSRVEDDDVEMTDAPAASTAEAAIAGAPVPAPPAGTPGPTV